MAKKIPSPVIKRLMKAVPKFQKILTEMRDKDVNEADTSTAIKDMLEEVFGWDKYEDITSEKRINATSCDIAVKLNGKIRYLIEVKAIGKQLQEKHMQQAVNYASNQGINWAILTNGIDWQIYRVTLEGRVKIHLAVEFDFTKINLRKLSDQDKLFLLCKRGTKENLMDEHYKHQLAVNPTTVSEILLSDKTISTIRVQLRQEHGRKASDEEIEQLLRENIIKRDIVDEIRDNTKGKKTRKSTKKPMPAFNFSMLNIKPGTTLYLKKDNSITCEVADERKVMYEGKKTSLSPLTKNILKAPRDVNGNECWCLEPNGLSLYDLRKEKESTESQ